MRIVAALTLLIGVAFLSAPASAAHCVKVIYKDKDGKVVDPGLPVVGLMLAGKPVMGILAPAGLTEVIGEDATCPQELVAKVEELFKASCVSEQSRKMTADASKIDIARVNQRCGDMGEALKPSGK